MAQNVFSDTVARSPTEAGLLDEFLTREQLAEEFGVSVRTLDRWHNLQIGPPRTMLGRRSLYGLDALHA